ncbi:MAG: bifunctional N-acetylglucosamine-1-phosphate uridyltransferase/glucosamine-1-phosphate acetyltransferase [Planctomycetes bacterium]|nr:bifunctional N-acetylglucosamine-1-phosphate uridyltransferase/glucosamine-1-phosphate acetyltransferase [Planctomycetota bacterium]
MKLDKNITTVVLAAGKGERMLSDIPKVLHEICGKPMLGILLDTVKILRFPAPYVVIGCGGNEVKKAFAGYDARWVWQKEQLGTAHAMLMVAPYLKKLPEKLLVLYGDVPLIRPESIDALIRAHSASKAVLTVLTACVFSPSGYGRIISGKDGSLLDIVEDKNASAEQKRINEINTGIYVMNFKACLPLIKEIRKDKLKKEYYLTDLVKLLLQRGLPVKRHFADYTHEFMGINTQAELAGAVRLLLNRKLDELYRSGVRIIDPNTAYIEPGVEIGRGTVIYPFVVIHNGVKIGRNCSVGPFTQLRGNTVLKDRAEIGNFTEVKSSVIGSHTKAKHLSYLGDAVIGRDVNIGAGTITANYDGVGKFKTIIDDGAFIGSNSVLVAPVKIGKNARTGATSVVTRNKNIPPGVTVAGVPARRLKD